MLDNELPTDEVERFSMLHQALAPVILELDSANRVTFSKGNPGDLLGLLEYELTGKCLTGFLHDKDLPIWELVRHRLTKVPHVGPFPLRLNSKFSSKGAFEVHVARSSVPDRILLALAPYHGTLSLGENKRPASSLALQFDKTNFSALGKRLQTFVHDKDASVVEALMALAGVGNENHTMDTETSLWTLYRLLYDAASDANQMKDHHSHDKVTDKAALTIDNDGSSMSSSVREAYIQDSNETNYVTVAGEDGISEAEAVKAAVYAMKQAASADAKTMQALTGGYEKRLGTVKSQLRVFKQIVVQERFEIALQPIVTVQDGQLHHYEALARFDKDVYAGTPFEFMCFAENVGVIQEFDLAMTSKVVSLIKRMRRIGYNISVAVNVSGHSIQSQAFLRHFFRILEDCGDIRDNLMFELTESSQIDDLEATNRVLSRIRDFGHKVALDDFGAGAAGLQYLRVLKVDCVKIDGVYIRKGIEDAENRSFLRSMAELCTGLNIETVGECVETEEQRTFLEEIGVTYAQGWLYGKPMPVDDTLKSLSDT